MAIPITWQVGKGQTISEQKKTNSPVPYKAKTGTARNLITKSCNLNLFLAYQRQLNFVQVQSELSSVSN